MMKRIQKKEYIQPLSEIVDVKTLTPIQDEVIEASFQKAGTTPEEEGEEVDQWSRRNFGFWDEGDDYVGSQAPNLWK